MDAHFPGADFGLASYGDVEDMDERLPLQKELENNVKNKEVTNDDIVIDESDEGKAKNRRIEIEINY